VLVRLSDLAMWQAAPCMLSAGLLVEGLLISEFFQGAHIRMLMA
jgi:hypothetical protein